MYRGETTAIRQRLRVAFPMAKQVCYINHSNVHLKSIHILMRQNEEANFISKELAIHCECGRVSLFTQYILRQNSRLEARLIITGFFLHKRIPSKKFSVPYVCDFSHVSLRFDPSGVSTCARVS